MIQVGSNLLVADNSGVKKVKCIRILKKTKKGTAKIGDQIIVSIKKSNLVSKVKEGEVLKALVVRTKKNLKRKNGTSISFRENSVVLLDKENQIIGTRIFGILPNEIRKTNIKKIISLAEEII